MNENTPHRFFNVQLTIIDVVDMGNTALAVVTGYNIGQTNLYLAALTGVLYALGKKFIDIARAKTPPK